MAGQTDGVRTINFGMVRVAPAGSDGTAGTYVDISTFVQSCVAPQSVAAGGSTGANDTATRMISSGRTTHGPIALTLFKSNVAAKVDALFRGFLDAIGAEGGGAFFLEGAEGTGAASATNPYREYRCVGIDGWENLSIDTERTDGATVSLNIAVDGAPDVTDS